MALIGYQRVSTDKQNTEAQQRALQEFGCDKIFTDHAVSGTATTRDGLDEALSYLREGDTLVVWKLDRLGRNTRHVLEILDQLHERGISFMSLKDSIHTDANGSAMQRAMSEAMITIMAAFAKLERDQLSERTKAGLETARKHGRGGGRREVTIQDKDVRWAKQLHDEGYSVKEIQEKIGKTRATVYRYLNIAREAELSPR